MNKILLLIGLFPMMIFGQTENKKDNYTLKNEFGFNIFSVTDKSSYYTSYISPNEFKIEGSGNNYFSGIYYHRFIKNNGIRLSFDYYNRFINEEGYVGDLYYWYDNGCRKINIISAGYMCIFGKKWFQPYLFTDIIFEHYHQKGISTYPVTDGPHLDNRRNYNYKHFEIWVGSGFGLRISISKLLAITYETNYLYGCYFIYQDIITDVKKINPVKQLGISMKF